MGHILVIDDEAGIRRVIRKILEKAGHTVDEAADGAEGEATFSHKRPDLVVTDLLMPGQSGLKTIGRLRDVDEAVPILAISGGARNGGLNFLSTARTFARVWTLEKPFESAELTGLVNEILAT